MHVVFRCLRDSFPLIFTVNDLILNSDLLSYALHTPCQVDFLLHKCALMNKLGQR